MNRERFGCFRAAGHKIGGAIQFLNGQLQKFRVLIFNGTCSIASKSILVPDLKGQFQPVNVPVTVAVAVEPVLHCQSVVRQSVGEILPEIQTDRVHEIVAQVERFNCLQAGRVQTERLQKILRQIDMLDRREVAGELVGQILEEIVAEIQVGETGQSGLFEYSLH